MNNEKVSILLVEDDLPYAVDLERQLFELGYDNVLTVDNSDKAEELLRSKIFHLILMDINIKGHLNGIELAESIKWKNIPVIFLTAFGDEQIYNRARETNPFAYMVKPVNPFTLKSLVENALLSSNNPGVAMTVFRLWQEEDLLQKNVFIKSRQKMIKVNLDDINYIEAQGNYCIFYTSDRKFAVKSSLKKIKQKLSPRRFVQVHRNFVVQVICIQHLDVNENVIRINGQDIPIGAKFKAGFLEHLNKL